MNKNIPRSFCFTLEISVRLNSGLRRVGCQRVSFIAISLHLQINSRRIASIFIGTTVPRDCGRRLGDRGTPWSWSLRHDDPNLRGDGIAKWKLEKLIVSVRWCRAIFGEVWNGFPDWIVNVSRRRRLGFTQKKTCLIDERKSVANHNAKTSVGDGCLFPPFHFGPITIDW